MTTKTIRTGALAAAAMPARALMAAVAILALAAALLPSAAGAEPSREALEALRERLDVIKMEFEGNLAGVGDPEEIAALSIRAAAMAWMEAAAVPDPDRLPFPQSRLEVLQGRWGQAEGSWPIRERAAMKACFEALGYLAANLVLSARKRDQQALEELASLLAKAAYHSPNRERTPAARLAMDRVFWSNRLNGAVAVLIRIQAPDRRAELDDIITDLVDRSEVICRRNDIHYLGRMDLLYLSNAQSLARMLFLLAGAEGSPMAEEAAALEIAWNGHAGDDANQVADAMSVTWVAAAQISFPLALWLASGGPAK
jgi:hypothetical protein